MSELLGTVVAERYELNEVIGQGAQGLVFKARDRQSSDEVAVKMLLSGGATDAQFVERLRREQQVMQVLRGTNAVEVRDLCTAPNGAPCLVMELLEGADLDTQLEAVEKQGGRVNVDWLLRVLGPVAETLHVAHRAGIVHRDLKPANVFLVSEAAGGGVRLLDFGLARLRAAQPLTALGTVVGSPSYIAPEVWQGRPDRVDHRADVYSLGVIVFRALSGQVPFKGNSLQDKLLLATTAERPSLCKIRPDLPKALDGWVRRSLAIDPAKRFSNVQVQREALELSARASPSTFSGSIRAAWEAFMRWAGDLGKRSDSVAAGPQSPKTGHGGAKPKDVDDQAPTLLWIRPDSPETEAPDDTEKSE